MGIISGAILIACALLVQTLQNQMAILAQQIASINTSYYNDYTDYLPADTSLYITLVIIIGIALIAWDIIRRIREKNRGAR